MNDLRFAFRQLLKNPGFTIVALLTLALGIGANTVVYSWIRGALENVLPGVREQAQLVVICPRYASDTLWDTCSYPDIEDFLAMTNVFSGVAGSQMGLASLGTDRSVSWVWAQPVTVNALNLLGIHPILGRGFLPEEQTPGGGHSVAILSCGLWQGRFGGETNIIGRNISINRRPFTVVGVAPPGFQGTQGGLRMDVWVPVAMGWALGLGPENLEARGDRWLHTLARLQPGISLAQAQAAMTAKAKQLEAAYPDSNRKIEFRVLPLWKAPYGGQRVMRPLLRALGAMALVVWLIVIANLSSLQLVRAADRVKEMAVRMALGARRRAILRQLLTESVALAVLGGALGLVLAGWAANSLHRFVPPTYMPVAYQFSLSGSVLWAAVAFSTVTGVLLGLAPAWHSMRTRPFAALKEGGRSGTAAGGRTRLRSGFVVAEIALTMALLLSAGLAYKSFQLAKHEDVGLDPRHVLLAGLRLEAGGYDNKTGPVFARKLRQRLAEIPGVQSVTAANWLPLGFEGGGSSRIRVEGYSESPGDNLSVDISSVAPGYFKTCRIPILEGRGFRESDDAQAPRVAIVNEEVVRRFFAGRDPIGAKIHFWGAAHRIVGVAKNGKYHSLGEPRQPFIYAAFAQHYEPHFGVAIRVAGDPYAFVSQLRAAIKDIDPGVSPFTLMSMTDYMGACYLVPRMASNLLVGVSLVTLFLSVLGIYGVMAYVVGQRRREIGIRMAMGATRSEVSRLVLRGGLKLALAGVCIGFPLAVVATRWTAGLLVGVRPTDPLTFATAAAFLTLSVLAACWLPARRASRVDPMEALRYE